MIRSWIAASVLSILLLLGPAACGGDSTEAGEPETPAAGAEEAPASEQSVTVAWNGEELPFTRISCRGLSQIYAFATISADSHYDFHFATEDGVPSRAELVIGDAEYYAGSREELAGIEYEVGVRAGGKVTLRADNDAARQERPCGGEVEFELIC